MPGSSSRRSGRSVGAEVITITVEALVRQYNVLMELVTENIVLRRELEALRQRPPGKEKDVEEQLSRE